MRGFPKRPPAVQRTRSLALMAVPFALFAFGPLASTASAAGLATIQSLDPSTVYTRGHSFVLLQSDDPADVTGITVDGVSVDFDYEGSGGTLDFYAPEHAVGTAQV